MPFIAHAGTSNESTTRMGPSSPLLHITGRAEPAARCCRRLQAHWLPPWRQGGAGGRVRVQAGEGACSSGRLPSVHARMTVVTIAYAAAHPPPPPCLLSADCERQLARCVEWRRGQGAERGASPGAGARGQGARGGPAASGAHWRQPCSHMALLAVRPALPRAWCSPGRRLFGWALRPAPPRLTPLRLAQLPAAYELRALTLCPLRPRRAPPRCVHNAGPALRGGRDVWQPACDLRCAVRAQHALRGARGAA